MAWTKAQQAAISQRGSNILVSAAAGSGKTAVLTQRVLERVVGNEKEAPISIDRFLIVTFTSAAAQEMKERIMGKLSDYMMKLQEQNNPKLQQKIGELERQMSIVHQASISTIHSFCLKTIKSYFNRLDIDPNVKVGNESDLKLMQYEILENLLEEKLEEQEADFMELADIYGSAEGMTPLIELILEVYTFVQSTPFPKMWLKMQTLRLTKTYSSLEEMPWLEAIIEDLKSQLMDLKALYQTAIELCTRPNGPGLYKEALISDCMYLEAIDESSSFKELIACVKNTSFKALSRKKQECDETLKEKVKEYREIAKKVFKSLKEDLAYIEDPKIVQHLPQIGRQMQTLMHLIESFELGYQAEKQKNSLLDYHDLEHFCLELLVEPHFNDEGEVESLDYTDVARELSEFYEEVYIDEYQDSNTVQEMILQAISEADNKKGSTRFMVGDMKQSIYRFRLANPLIFAEKYQNWDKYNEDNQNKKSLCIDLSQNFRSRQNILEAVNDLFTQIMSPEVGELEYDDYARLKVGNDYTEGEPEKLLEGSLAKNVELHILENEQMKEESAEEDSLEDLKNIEAEALMTADLIDQLLKGKRNPTHIFDKDLGAYRKIEARDIVILLRATKNKTELFESALLAKGIGAYADVNGNFFDAVEVQTMISYLQLIDNPFQDIPLITVLRSPIVGVSMDELVYIRKSLDKGCFYEALQVYCAAQDEKHPLKQFLTKLLIDREKSSELSLEELISEVYVETGYYRYVSMLPTGAKKRANLELLKNYAMQYEANNNGKLFGFMQYLLQLSETSEGLKEAKVMNTDENMVRIMSIHKSKGLEFSVVFLCDTAKRFNMNDLKNTVLMHNRYGLAPTAVDLEENVVYPTLPRMAIKSQIMRENISEEMRVLYVALTRAKEKLFITGTVKRLEDKIKTWALFKSDETNRILPLGLKKYATYLDWIGMSLFAHSQFSDFRDLINEKVAHLFEGQAKWQMELWNKEKLGKLKNQDEKGRIEKKILLDTWDIDKQQMALYENVKAHLDFCYAYEKAVLLPTKVSVSEIKKQSVQAFEEENSIQLFSSNDVEKTVPNFMKSKEILKGAKRGTLIHAVLEHIDYLKLIHKDEMKQAIEDLVQKGILKQEVLEVVDSAKIAKLAQSDVVSRMRKSARVWKEKAFMYLAKANLVDAAYPENEEILIQGVVDACFIEEDELVILDYKTDYVDKNEMQKSIDKIKKRYQKQLELYALALEDITGLKVKEKMIYLYAVDRWIGL